MKRIAVLVLALAACSSEKDTATSSPPTSGTKGDVDTGEGKKTKTSEPATVDCASLLSIDDVAKTCTLTIDQVKHEQRGNGRRGSACTVSVRSKVPGQSNTVRVDIESDPKGSAKTKISLARSHADARVVSVGEEGVARTEKVPALSVDNRDVTQTNETVRARKGPYWIQLTHLVREGDQPNIACTPDAMVELAKLVVSRLPS